MRVLVAGLIGGIVMFLWGVAAHMALGLGEVGLRLPVNENVALSGLQQGLGDQAGVYILPALDPQQMDDAAGGPHLCDQGGALAVCLGRLPAARHGHDADGPADRAAMGVRYAGVAGAGVRHGAGRAGFPSALGDGRGRRRVRLAHQHAAVLEPGTASRSISRSAALAEQLIGWLLAGAAMAWWLGRGERPRAAAA
ncbi:hypothetical protein [Rhodanobacter lindaniclasticus]